METDSITSNENINGHFISQADITKDYAVSTTPFGRNTNSQLNNSSTTEYYYDYDPLCDFGDNDFWGEKVDDIATYVIVAVGLVSNVIAIVVLLASRRVRKTPSGIFLVSLTFADSLVLISERLHTLAYPVHGTPLGPHMDHVTCGLLWYFKYTSRFAASYIVVTISVNRFMVLVYPFKSRYFTGFKNALWQMLSIFIVSCVVSAWAPFFPENSHGLGCDLIESLRLLYFKVTLVIDVIICDIVSSFVIIALSIWTIKSVTRSRRRIRRCNSTESDHSKAEDHQLTGTLLVICISFAVLRLPFIITWFPVILLPECSKSVITVQNAFHISHSIMLLNHALNLYLYCACSSSFRENFKRLCTCDKKKKGRQWSTGSVKTEKSRLASISTGSNNITVSNKSDTYV